MEALLATEISEDTDGNSRIWSDWKCDGLHLVRLALSGPEEVLQWFLSQLLRYSFCVICGNELEGLALIAQQKSLFPRWLALHHPFFFLSHITLGGIRGGAEIMQRH